METKTRCFKTAEPLNGEKRMYKAKKIERKEECKLTVKRKKTYSKKKNEELTTNASPWT
jgi:hypothetical protein